VCEVWVACWVGRCWSGAFGFGNGNARFRGWCGFGLVWIVCLGWMVEVGVGYVSLGLRSVCFGKKTEMQKGEERGEWGGLDRCDIYLHEGPFWRRLARCCLDKIGYRSTWCMVT